MFIKILVKKQILEKPEFLYFDEKAFSFVSLDNFEPDFHRIIILPKGHSSFLLRIPDFVSDHQKAVENLFLYESENQCILVSDHIAFLEISRWIINYSSRFDSSMNVYQIQGLDADNFSLLESIYNSYFYRPDSEFFLKQQVNFKDSISMCQIFEKLFSYLQSLDQLYSILLSRSEPVFFPDYEAVLVVIPTYGHIDYTVSCIASIYRDLIIALNNKVKIPKLNILIADDCFPDPLYKEKLNKLNDLCIVDVYFQKSNLGFLLNCNNAVKSFMREHHKYIVFLNNDIEVLPGWMVGLLGSFGIFNNVGLVGSQQISFQGNVQDSGGIVWKDGSAWNYGKGCNPLDPEFNFARSVDYISAASVMIKSEIWKRLNGFDEFFKPAYYEDTDLCMSVRELGYKVIYQPTSKVFHAEGVSNGCDESDSGSIKNYQKINREKFVNKWEKQLEGQFNNAENVDQALHSQKHSSALVIEDLLLSPDEDAGSLYMMNNCLALQELGYSITYIPADNFCYAHDKCVNMGARGIEVLAHPKIRSIDDLAMYKGSIPFEYERKWDLIILCRPARKPDIAKLRLIFPSTKIAYYTHDLHYSRFLSHSKSAKSEHQINYFNNEASRMLEIEKSIFSSVDLVFHVSQEEQEAANKICPHQSIYINPVVERPQLDDEGFDDSNSDIVFIGSFNHQPNLEGISWFLKDIWSDISKQRPDCKLHIIGKNAPPDFIALANTYDSVVFHGYLKSLSPIFRKCSIGIAPLLSGAGVKGKVLTYLSHGLGVVSTSFGAQGLPQGSPDILSINQDAHSFTQSLMKMMDLTPHQRRITFSKALEYIDSNFSESSLILSIKKALSILGCPFDDSVSTFTSYSPADFDSRYSIDNSFTYYTNNNIVQC